MTRKGVEANVRLAQLTLEAFMRPRADADGLCLPPTPKKARIEHVEEHLDEFAFVRPVQKTETRGRPPGSTKYVVRVMPPAVVEKALALLSNANEDAATIRRLVQDFRSFQEMNRIERDDVALFFFLYDIGDQGLKASTLKSYAKLILEGTNREGKPIKGPVVKDTFKILNIMEAEDDVEHAPDFTDAELEEIFRSLSEGLLRLTFWTLRLCGCRAADGERLNGTSFRIIPPEGAEAAKLKIFFRVTKNRRRKSESFSITTTPTCWIKEFSLFFEKECLTKLMGCDSFNRQLREHMKEKNILQDERGKRISTYSLRRNFIQRMIKRHTVGDTTEWLEVAKLTGHHGAETLRSSYTYDNFYKTL